MANAAQSTRRFGADVTRVSLANREGMQTLGIAATAAGGAMLAGLGASAKAAIDFESSFAGVRKTVEGTDAELEALSDGFRDMARDIPVSVNELNRIGEAAGQLGIQTDNILGFTRVMADLGVATNLSSEQAATSLARLANITQMPEEDFDRLGSAVVLLGNKLETTESEIVDFGLRIAGAGAVAGLTEGQILGIGAAMSSVGVESEAGGTAVQKVLIGMTQSVASADDKLQVFAATAGMSAAEFQTAWRKDAAGAFIAFVEGLGRAGNDAFTILETLDLQDQRLIRSFITLAGAGGKLRESIDLGTQGWNENTALLTEAERRYGTTASQIQLALNSITELAIVMGQILLPALQVTAGLVAEFADFISGLPGPLQVGAVALTALGGSVLLLGGGLVLLVPRIYATKVALTDLGVTAKLTSVSLATVGRVGLGLVGGLAALAAGWLLLRNRSRENLDISDQLVEALRLQGSEAEAAARRLVSQQLETAGLLTQFEGLGVPLDLVVDAITGVEGAAGRLSGELATLAASGKLTTFEHQKLWGQTILLEAQFRSAENEAERLGNAEGDVASGAKGAAVGLAGLTAEQKRLLGITGAATSALDEQREALEKMVSPVTSMQGAMRAHADAQRRIDELRAKSPAREIAAAERDIARAARDVASAQERVADAEQKIADIRARDRSRELLEARLDAEEAALNLADATAEHEAQLYEEGATSEEARRAFINLERSRLRNVDAQDHLNEVTEDDRTEDLAEATRELEEAKDNLEDAVLRQQDAQGRLNDIRANGADIARDLADAEAELAAASIDLSLAALALQAAVQAGDTSLEGMMKMLDGLVAAGLLTQEQADRAKAALAGVFAEQQRLAGGSPASKPFTEHAALHRQHGGMLGMGWNVLGEAGREAVFVGSGYSARAYDANSTAAMLSAAGGSSQPISVRGGDIIVQGSMDDPTSRLVTWRQSGFIEAVAEAVRASNGHRRTGR